MKQYAHRSFIVLFAAIILMTWTGSKAQAYVPSQNTVIPQNQNYENLIVRIVFINQADLETLTTQLDVWEVNRTEGYLVALVTQAAYQDLLKAGYQVEIDEKRTIEINTPRVIDPNQINGIPGYSCYRTVEETQTALNNLATNYPDLVEKIDIGNSWDKDTAGEPTGYDIWALKITNRATKPVFKPVFFLMAEIHAREYVTTETAMRFAEYLVQNYNVDPDITWLLDNYEIHIVPLTNPDGRKFAEAGQLWRKNTDNDDGCTLPGYYGTDLNRNSDFHWDQGGSSDYACDETYHGPTANSEPETQAIQTYAATILRDQRGPGDEDPAPADTTGEFITLHSYSQLVLWPYGFRSAPAPNNTQLQTLGRKLAFYNLYTPEQSVGLYPTSGTTDDWAYGIFGVAAYTFEMGTNFFQDCSYFENTIYPDNRDALLYAFKAARRPYMEPAGPDSLDVTATPTGASTTQSIHLTATINDQRYNNSNGGEPTQNIKAAEYYIDTPPWATGAVAHPMSVVDGAWNEKIEEVEATIDTFGLSRGRHIVFVRGQDTNNNWGVPSAAFFYIVDPAIDPTIEGYVRDGGNNAPLSAGVNAWIFQTTSDPATGYYRMAVISDTYRLSASAPGHVDIVIPNVQANDYQTVRQDIYLMPSCTVLDDNVEADNIGWTPQSPWAITNEASHSPTHSWTDSPGGYYSTNRNISLTSQLFNLTGYNDVTLSFWHIYDTEPGYDFCYVEYSTNGGTSWTAITSYNGYAHTTWEKVNILLPALDNHNNSKIRFRFQSDGSVQKDGWHIDDIQLSGTGSACFTPLAPAAEFTSTTPVDQDVPIHFTDLSVGTPPFTYTWDFGDGMGSSIDSNPIYTYTSAGTFTVTLTLTNSLGSDSVSHPVTVNPVICTPIIGITLTTPISGTIYPGEIVPFNLDLFPDQATKPYTYTVDYGDNTPELTSTSSQDPFTFSHTYQQTGTFTVTFEAWNCAMVTPITDTLQVIISPIALNHRIYLPVLIKSESQAAHPPTETSQAWWAVLPIGSWIWLKRKKMTS